VCQRGPLFVGDLGMANQPEECVGQFAVVVDLDEGRRDF